MKQLILLSAMMLSVTGCPPGPQMPPPAPTNPPSMKANPKLLLQRGNTPANAASTAQLQVDCYQLTVPLGAISRNEQFWKHVDEQTVDVATYDLLYKNGIRVGQAPIAEWDYFRDIMQQQPTQTKANTVMGVEAKPVELPMRKEVRSQEITYLDSKNEIQGRSWDESENFITIAFQAAPRKPGTIRVALCPVVRATRKHLEYSTLNKELGEVKYVAPERLYDLNLRTDIPPDHFLIVAPSARATWPTSIGNAFLVTDGPAEKMETVLLIVPKTSVK